MSQYNSTQTSSEHILSRQTKQLLVEMNYFMPDNKPKMNSIVSTEVVPSVSAVLADESGLNYNLTAECNIIYNATTVIGEEEHTFTTACSFSKLFKESFETDEDEPSAFSSDNKSYSVSVNTDNVETLLVSERKVLVKAYITVSLLAKETLSAQAISTFNDEKIISRSAELDIVRSLGIFRAQSFVKEDITLDGTLPPIDTVIAKSVSVTIDNKKFSDNKAVFYGTAHIDIIYSNADAEERFHTTGFDISFNQMCEVGTVSDNAFLNVTADMSELTLDVKENNVLGVEGLISYEVEPFDSFSYDIVDDAFKTDADLVLQKIVTKSTSSAVSSNTVGACSEKQNLPDISRLLMCTVSQKECQAKVDGKNIIFDGIYSIKTFYVPKTDKNTVLVNVSELPFSYSFESSLYDADVLSSEISVKSVSAEVNDFDDVNIKWIATADALVAKTDEVGFITDYTEEEPKEKLKHAFYYHHIEDGESLWDVAKKFRTTPSDIIKLNKLTDTPDISLLKGIIVIVK